MRGDILVIMVPRLLEKYRKETVPALMQKFGYKNRFQVPRLKKIAINIGVGAFLPSK